MPILNADTSNLVVIDLQGRLMPAIHEGESVIAQANRLIAGARAVGVSLCATEQNPDGLGHTVDAVDLGDAPVFAKMSFDATRAPGLLDWLPIGHAAVVAGCESHVCVLQTVLGLRAQGCRVAVVRDAVGSRTPESKAAALDRMAREGAEIVTAEMVLFEWLGDADHPAFRDVIRLVK